ncbi:MAG: ankyrin repeat domain-containing protein [Candidatus Babeliaceae bacterium]|jgi:ankyrin repeat protein
MKNSIALYALVCLFAVPTHAMEEGCGPLVQNNYFEALSDEVISEVIYQLIDVFENEALLKDSQSFLLTDKRFNRIGKTEFINHALIKTNFYQLNNNKAHIAALFNSTELLKELLENGKNKNLINQHNAETLTPLHMAVAYNAYDAASLLIDSGADVGVEDGKKLQPLHYAICNNNLSMVTLLLNKRAHVGPENTGLLAYAKKRGNTEIIKALELAITKKQKNNDEK